MSASPPPDRPLAWLHGVIATPPMSKDAKRAAGFLLRRVQRGEMLSMPESRPMPSIGRRCHELRIEDEDKIWRIIYRIDLDAILILDVFQKKTQQTSVTVKDNCRRRLRQYDSV